MDSAYFTQLLHDRKLKATTPRLSLLAVMDEYKSAIPYSEIQKAMKPIDRVTLYRTLESLLSKGLIHKAYQEGSEVFYAFCGVKCSVDHHQHNHIHFKCEKCDSVTCEKPDKSLKVALAGYAIHKVSIVLEGICKRCNVA